MGDRGSDGTPPLAPAARAWLLAAYAVYLASVAYLVWSPSSGAPTAAVARAIALLARLGVGVSGNLVEFGLNVLMLVPLSLLGGLLLPRLRVTDWLSIGFCLSSLVEIVQRLVLPTRSDSSRDIVANTLGALVGAIALSVVLMTVQAYRDKSR